MTENRLFDIQDAIAAHLRWRVRLQRALAGDALPDEDVTRSDACCALGGWLQEAAAQWQAEPAFVHLCAVHTEFHLDAADCVHLVRRGLMHEARRSIRTGAFDRASNRVLDALLRLQARMTAGHGDG